MPSKPKKQTQSRPDLGATRRKYMACCDKLFDLVAARVPAPVLPEVRQMFHDSIRAMVLSNSKIDKGKQRAVKMIAKRCMGSKEFEHMANFVLYVMEKRGYTMVASLLPPVEKPRAKLVGYHLERSRLEETRLVERETKKASANSKGGMVAHL
tara:strand:- start:27 stop:485 length:459 start_codon:yes stop_codon:yes gene_type:complete